MNDNDVKIVAKRVVPHTRLAYNKSVPLTGIIPTKFVTDDSEDDATKLPPFGNRSVVNSK